MKRKIQKEGGQEDVQENLHPSRKKRKKDGTENDVLELLPFKTIENGLIWHNDGSVQAVIGVDSIHYHLLSEQEKKAVDGALASLLASLSFPIQPLSITRPVDLKDYVDALSNMLREAPDVLQEYGRDHLNFLDHKTKQEVLIKQDYVVFGVEQMEDVQKMKAELDRRAGLIISGLRRAGLFARVLDTEDVAAVFYDVYHGNRAIRQRLSDAFKQDYFSLYVSGQEAEQSTNPAAPPPPPGSGEETTTSEASHEGKRVVMLG